MAVCAPPRRQQRPVLPNQLLSPGDASAAGGRGVTLGGGVHRPPPPVPRARTQASPHPPPPDMPPLPPWPFPSLSPRRCGRRADRAQRQQDHYGALHRWRGSQAYSLSPAPPLTHTGCPGRPHSVACVILLPPRISFRLPRPHALPLAQETIGGDHRSLGGDPKTLGGNPRTPCACAQTERGRCGPQVCGSSPRRPHRRQ